MRLCSAWRQLKHRPRVDPNAPVGKRHSHGRTVPCLAILGEAIGDPVEMMISFQASCWRLAALFTGLAQVVRLAEEEDLIELSHVETAPDGQFRGNRRLPFADELPASTQQRGQVPGPRPAPRVG